MELRGSTINKKRRGGTISGPDVDGSGRSRKKQKPTVAVPVAAAVTAGNSNSSANRGDSPLAVLPVGCWIAILNFLDQTSLLCTSVVSKRLHEDCWHDGIENGIIPVYEISPRTRDPYSGLFSTAALLRKLCRNQVGNNDKFSRYKHLKVNRIDDYEWIPKSEVAAITVQNDKRTLIEGVSSLDISLPALKMMNRSVIDAMVSMLPNVREVNLSNIVIDDTDMFRDHTSLLEKVTWNNSVTVTVQGWEFRDCGSLKELIMDDSNFPITRQYGFHRLSNLSGNDGIFIFLHCRSIERLSIRRAKLRSVVPDRTITGDLPQNALIKFVRNAPPSLRWFRSDLTKENIDILRKEHPGIEFLN